VAIVVIQPLLACHYLSVFNVHVYIPLFKKYVWLQKQTCRTFVNLVQKKNLWWEKVCKHIYKSMEKFLNVV